MNLTIKETAKIEVTKYLYEVEGRGSDDWYDVSSFIRLWAADINDPRRYDARLWTWQPAYFAALRDLGLGVRMSVPRDGVLRLQGIRLIPATRRHGMTAGSLKPVEVIEG